MTGGEKNRLLRSAPYFPVADLDRAVNHYEKSLGFLCEYVGGEPAEFAIMSRDGLPIMLRVATDAEAICPNERQGGTWDVFFWVSGIDALAAELIETGAEVAYGPVVQDAYQMKEFAVRDLDGYVLGFGEQVQG